MTTLLTTVPVPMYRIVERRVEEEIEGEGGPSLAT